MVPTLAETERRRQRQKEEWPSGSYGGAVCFARRCSSSACETAIPTIAGMTMVLKLVMVDESDDADVDSQRRPLLQTDETGDKGLDKPRQPCSLSKVGAPMQRCGAGDFRHSSHNRWDLAITTPSRIDNAKFTQNQFFFFDASPSQHERLPPPFHNLLSRWRCPFIDAIAAIG